MSFLAKTDEFQASVWIIIGLKTPEWKIGQDPGGGIRSEGGPVREPLVRNDRASIFVTLRIKESQQNKQYCANKQKPEVGFHGIKVGNIIYLPDSSRETTSSICKL